MNFLATLHGVPFVLTIVDSTTAKRFYRVDRKPTVLPMKTTIVPRFVRPWANVTTAPSATSVDRESEVCR